MLWDPPLLTSTYQVDYWLVVAPVTGFILPLLPPVLFGDELVSPNSHLLLHTETNGNRSRLPPQLDRCCSTSRHFWSLARSLHDLWSSILASAPILWALFLTRFSSWHLTTPTKKWPSSCTWLPPCVNSPLRHVQECFRENVQQSPGFPTWSSHTPTCNPV